MQKRIVYLVIILTAILAACENVTIKNTFYRMQVQVYGDTLIFSGDKEQRAITVESDAPWKVAVAQEDWLQADSIAVNQFELTADSNSLGQARYATVTVTNDSSEQRSFVVYQRIHTPEVSAAGAAQNFKKLVLSKDDRNERK